MAGVLAIRKTLVLGVGTTGREVAERLAEHLTWQFGGLERAAWVRLLVLETEQPASSLGDRILWGGMKPDEYSQYILQPRTAGAEFGFFDWQDGPTLSKITNPATGAGNLRMLGRLALFHPRNYENLRMRVTRDIGALDQLTPQTVADQLGEPGISVKIHSDTVVYVVGTLCGGTCSGGGADLGYLLDIWSNGSVNRQAIFTIPHPGLGRSEAPRYKKNAYYALKELNHYQLSENPWIQRLPGFNEPFVRNNVPYDILRVVMPGGPAGDDVVRLNAMIAQYLAAAVGPAGAEIAANDVNALGKMASTENLGFMRPLFSTVGVAALEYPGEHIQRAATSRLLSSMLDRWCRHSLDTDVFDAAMRGLGGSDFDGLLQRLTQGADAISGSLLQEVAGTLNNGGTPRVDQVRQLLRDIDGRLQAMTAPPDAAAAVGAPPVLLQVMQANQEAFVQRIGTDIQRFLDQYLFRLDGGPGLVAEAFKRCLGDMEAWAAAAEKSLPEQQQDARSLRDILDQHLAEADRIQRSPLPFGKKEKLKHAWDDVTESLRAYVEAEVKTQAITHLQRRDLVRDMVEQYRRVTASLLRRLEQMQAAFSQEASEFEKRWKEMASSSPSINGRVYFQPEPPAPSGTVTDEYFNVLRQRRWPDEPASGWDDAKKEEAAQGDVLKAFEPLREEMTRDDGGSAFDPRPGIQTAREMLPRSIMAAAEARARAFFAALRTQVHIADKASDTDISTVILLSEPKLGVSATQVSDQLAGVRGVTPAHQDLAFADVETGGQNRPSVEALQQRILNNMQLQRGQITDSDDPFRLLLIRERHGFTLGQMEGVVRANSHDLTSLQSADYCNDFHFWHTRRDVDWVDPLVPPSQVESAEQTWLLAVLLGRAADGMLEWTPANRHEIEPEGWYTLASGEFRVYYPPGTLDVSEREARLPRTFAEAVAKLLRTEFAVLRRSLAMRFSSYRDKVGDDVVVRALDQALEALDIFGLTDIDRNRADRIVRRAYRRNEDLTRAFFGFRTSELDKARAEFAHLHHSQGDPIPDKNSRYPADGYYCPDCNNPLGADVQNLLDAMFRCPACNKDERYWP